MRNSGPTLTTLSLWLYQCRDWNWKSVASKPCGNKKCSSQRFSCCWQFWQCLISNSIFHINPLSPFWQSIIGVKERLGQSPSSSRRTIRGIGWAESMLISPWWMQRVPQYDWGSEAQDLGSGSNLTSITHRCVILTSFRDLHSSVLVFRLGTLPFLSLLSYCINEIRYRVQKHLICYLPHRRVNTC